MALGGVAAGAWCWIRRREIRIGGGELRMGSFLRYTMPLEPRDQVSGRRL